MTQPTDAERLERLRAKLGQLSMIYQKQLDFLEFVIPQIPPTPAAAHIVQALTLELSYLQQTTGAINSLLLETPEAYAQVDSLLEHIRKNYEASQAEAFSKGFLSGKGH